MKTTIIVTVSGGVVQNVECPNGGDVTVLVRDYDVDSSLDVKEISESFCFSEGVEFKDDESGKYEESRYEF